MQRLIPGDLARDEDGRVFFPRQVGAAIWQFPGSTAQSIICAALQARDHRLLVEVDDNYTTIEAGHDATGWRYGAARSGRDVPSVEAHMSVAGFADGIIVSTPHLRDIYSRLNANVYLCPNSIDPSDWPEPPDREGREVIRVGFAGSDSHAPDLALVTHVLAWASEQPGLEAVLYGLDPGWRFPHKIMVWTDDRDAYRRRLSDLDIGLVPLRETPWSRGKSDLKIMEYAMAGVAPVVGDALPFQGWRDVIPLHPDGRAMLEDVKALAADPALRAERVQAVREHILAERTIEKNIWRWREALSA